VISMGIKINTTFKLKEEKKTMFAKDIKLVANLKMEKKAEGDKIIERETFFIFPLSDLIGLLDKRYGFKPKKRKNVIKCQKH